VLYILLQLNAFEGPLSGSGINGLARELFAAQAKWISLAGVQAAG
jgi:hypothetical protein